MAKRKGPGRPRRRGRPSKKSLKRSRVGKAQRRYAKKYKAKTGRKPKVRKGRGIGAVKRKVRALLSKRGRRSKADKKLLAKLQKRLRKAGWAKKPVRRRRRSRK